MATNPVVSLPDADKIRRALRRCPLVVVSDCIADTDTTRCADVLLPAQGWSEKSGTVTNSERRISRQRRLLPTPGEGRPDWWIMSQVARRMGYEKAFDYAHEGEVFEEYARMTGLDYRDSAQRVNRDLDLTGLAGLSSTEYARLSPQQWPLPRRDTDIPHKRLFADGRYFTPSGKARFIAVRFQPPASRLSKAYPLSLNSGRIRDQWHTMTRTGLSARLTPAGTLCLCQSGRRPPLPAEPRRHRHPAQSVGPGAHPGRRVGQAGARPVVYAHSLDRCAGQCREGLQSGEPGHRRHFRPA